MKKILLLVLMAVTLVACKKDHAGTPTVLNNKIAGKWNIISVTVIALDSTFKSIPGKGYVYTNPPDNYFQFNVDGTWREQLVPDSAADLGITGNYVVKSDTSFILSNPNPTTQPVNCSIISLTPTLFVFSHQRPAKFDAVQTPGYLKYVFKLTR